MSRRLKRNEGEDSSSTTFAPMYEDNDFPWLLRALREGEEGHANRFRPEDVDDVTLELRKMFEMCGVSAANDKNSERTEALMITFTTFYNSLASRAENGGSEDKALLRLLQHSITSSTSNLECLLRASRAAFRTGPIRCMSTVLLASVMVDVSSVWSIKLTDGSRFLTSLIAVLSESLYDDANRHGDMNHYCPAKVNGINVCTCTENKLMSLAAAVIVSKEKPGIILDLVHHFDWPSMFQMDTTDAQAALAIFCRLHGECISVLQVKRRDEKAEAFLRKLGSCHKLFRWALQQVVSGQFCSADTAMEDITLFCSFVADFTHSLSNLPRDGATSSLVVRAHRSLRRSTEVLDGEARQWFDKAVALLDPQDWKRNCRARLTDDELWTRQLRSVSQKDPASFKNFGKNRRAFHRSQLESPEHPSMCANCFVMEDEIDEKLKQCSRCKLVTYCCRACQAEHWKKGHKHQCNK